MCWLKLKKHTYFLRLAFRFKFIAVHFPYKRLIYVAVFPPNCKIGFNDLVCFGCKIAALVKELQVSKTCTACYIDCQNQW